MAKTPLEQRLFAELLGYFLRLVGVQARVLGGGPHAGFETARADLRNRIFHNEKNLVHTRAANSIALARAAATLALHG
jgi:hypothetical protein